jgi:D-serine deaminase-like pyridoxal phosphate-dependent protein
MKWLQLANPESIASPGLLVDADRVAANIKTMIQAVGGPEAVSRLRPHVKTHKMPEVIRLQLGAGISQFKAATIAEVKMVAEAGGRDILLAYQPVGPNLQRLADLVAEYPQVSFAAVCDDIDAAKRAADRLGDATRPFRLFIDIDCGMHRTGIPLGDGLDRLRDFIESLSGVQFAGLHIYDGHIHDSSLQARREKAVRIIDSLRNYQQTAPAPTIIGGGSPTFGIWAAETSWQCSPGTPLLWDVGYATMCAESDFLIAAALLTRVISKPTSNLVCLDLGHKSVAAEMPLPQRVTIPSIPDAQLVGQSEEHLVVETSQAADLHVGDPLLAFPRHICPTVALHAFATVIRDGRATGEIWQVTARDR